MRTVVGSHGDGIRGDARVTVEDAASLRIEIQSLVESMYGQAIRKQAEVCTAGFGNPTVEIHIEDSGALPYVLEARLESALSRHLGAPLPTIEPTPCEPVKDRLRRTRLYIPGNTPKFITNAGLYEADGVILDLEDSVPEAEKETARALVRRALLAVDFGRSERMVRVNSGEQGKLDMTALAQAGVELFLLPKMECAQEIREIDDLLTQLGSPAFLLPILESAKGVHFAYEIASASPRVIGISMGIEDYLADIQATKTDQGVESAWAHGQIVNAARAVGVSPFASVFSVIDDDASMEAYANRVSRLGFDGVGCIHPRQVRPAHRGFAPSQDEFEKAQAIVQEYEKAISENLGAIRVNGQMVDAPVYARAKRTVSLAEEVLA